jgi:hypothetical protein
MGHLASGNTGCFLIKQRQAHPESQRKLGLKRKMPNLVMGSSIIGKLQVISGVPAMECLECSAAAQQQQQQ